MIFVRSYDLQHYVELCGGGVWKHRNGYKLGVLTSHVAKIDATKLLFGNFLRKMGPPTKARDSSVKVLSVDCPFMVIDGINHWRTTHAV